MTTTISLSGGLTLAEMVRREDPNGQTAQIVNVLNQRQEVLEDMTWAGCNNGTYHEATRRAFEPAGTHRGYNLGISPEAAGTEKVTEPTVMLNGLSVVDEALLRHSPNGAAIRAAEDAMYMDGMVKTFLTRFFDGDRSADPLSIYGLNKRADYNVLSSNYVYDNGGGNASATANKSSLYMIQWGDGMVNMIYPRNDAQGGTMPVRSNDMGLDLVNDAKDAPGQYPGYRTWLELHYGLFITDPRCVKRIANISTSNLANSDEFAFDEEVFFDMVKDMEYGGRGAVLYCNRLVWAQMQKRVNVKGNLVFTQDKETGDGGFARPVKRINGIPVKIVDAIASNQAKVS